MNYRLIIGGVVLVAIVAVAVWVIATPAKIPVGQACTMEAKLCPDGSYVSRTGPNCEFTQCPALANNSIAVGGTGVVNGTTISVLELIEDSRCPVDVQCIQAGTVRVRVSIDSYNKDFILTLGQSQVVNNVTIELTSVIPIQKYSTKEIKTSDYRFTFAVAPVATTSQSGSGVRGTILLGPTCPVMRDPPDPQCADKPYATTILVYRVGSNSVVATGRSAVNGSFEIPLRAGTYTLAAQGSTILPRCSTVEVLVPDSGYARADISCDTGIR